MYYAGGHTRSGWWPWVALVSVKLKQENSNFKHLQSEGSHDSYMRVDRIELFPSVCMSHPPGPANMTNSLFRLVFNLISPFPASQLHQAS